MELDPPAARGERPTAVSKSLSTFQPDTARIFPSEHYPDLCTTIFQPSDAHWTEKIPYSLPFLASGLSEITLPTARATTGVPLRSGSMVDLYQHCLERAERAAGRRPTRSLLSLLWASRGGLSGPELVGISGRSAREIEVVLQMLENHLAIGASGLLSFATEHIEHGVEQRYLLNDGSAETTARLRIAEYFSQQSLSTRSIEEWPWQLAQAGEWDRLRECVVHPPTFLALNTSDHYAELKEYWRLLDFRYDLLQEYEQSIADYGSDRQHEAERAKLWLALGEFFVETHRPDNASRLFLRALSIQRTVLGPDHPYTALTARRIERFKGTGSQTRLLPLSSQYLRRN